MRPDRYDDGMRHTYETCPCCGVVASTEDIVSLDGQKMCRGCLKRESAKPNPGVREIR